MNKEHFKSDTLIGETVIPLTSLKDQGEKEEWKDLLKDKNKVGKIKLNLKWILSKVKLYEDVLKEENNKFEVANNDRAYYQIIFEILGRILIQNLLLSKRKRFHTRGLVNLQIRQKDI